MPRAISIGSALVALVFLVLVLADATLVDRRPPSVTEVRLSATAGGDRIAEPIASINVVFSETVRTSTAESRFHIDPVVAGALSWDGPTLIFTPSAPLPAATDFVVTVEPGYVDLAGNVASTGIDEWAFATAGPPRVLGAEPPEGAAGLAVDSTVELQFDRLMDTTSVEQSIVINPRVSFRASWSGSRLVLAFDTGLAFGTAYTLELEQSAADTSGAHLVVPFSLHFFTVSAGLDARVIPADDVAGISVRAPIAVLFDGPIEPTTALDALTVTPAIGGDTEVLSDPNGGPASVLIFRPSSPLAENTTYTVTLAPVVHKLGDAGQVAAGRTWSFTTGSETESAQNQIAFLSDRSGVNLWLINPDGTNARQLTWELAPVTAFDVTGDGRRLVYAVGNVVATLNVDGSEPHVLTDADQIEAAPRLSPDETKILLGRRDSTGADLGWWLVPTPWTFGDERQVVRNGAPTQATGSPGSQPAFDGDGSHALVPSPDGSLVVVDLLAADEIAPTSSTGVRAFGAPTWSAFARAFIVAGMSGTETTPFVHRIDAAGHDVSLRGIDKVGGPIGVDEAGRMLVARNAGGAGRGLLLLDPEGRELDDLSVNQALLDLAATFSPDGERVVVARAQDDGSSASAGLWLIDLEITSQSRLTIDGSDPRWLP